MNNLLSEKDTNAVLNILVEQLGVDRDKLTLDAKLMEDLGADSLTVAEVTLALEEQFQLTIPDEVWERVSTVGDVFEVLVALLENTTRRTG